jgi:acyl-CoA dehydrogenase family protein 9
VGTVSREKQIAQAEEMFGERLQRASFAKGLFFGYLLPDKLAPYPPPATAEVSHRVEQLRQFCQQHIDPVQIDRQADIPRSVIDGLGRLGVLGACMPSQYGGLGMTQTDYCRLLEVLGAHCASTALFVNAHHSIGPRALVLFGTPQQQAKWLPRVASGEIITAFALTEPEAGSDAANVQTRADPTADGRGYILNGQKRYITNGALAGLLTVMARTPVAGSRDTRITAFLVTPDLPGFHIAEARMDKCGVRGTATSRLEFRDMFVPRDSLLGQEGRGLRVALTVLDFGRTTFGATCTGAAKFCLRRAVDHARTRVQFGQPLAAFELVKEKLASMAASIFAMEACTYQTAAQIDSGADDYMLETAMLKVFATEALWRIIHDTFQIHGGMAYFTDQPWERMLRDHRIDLIGEGANDVLRAFVALAGMRDVGLELQGVLQALRRPIGNLGRLGGFAARRLAALLLAPEVPVHSSLLEDDAARLGRLIGRFGNQVQRLLRHHREEILDRQYLQARIAEAAIDLYVSCCVLRRLDRLLRAAEEEHHATPPQQALAAGRYYLAAARRRILAQLRALWDHDDAATTQLADGVLRHVQPLVE